MKSRRRFRKRGGGILGNTKSKFNYYTNQLIPKCNSEEVKKIYNDAIGKIDKDKRSIDNIIMLDNAINSIKRICNISKENEYFLKNLGYEITKIKEENPNNQENNDKENSLNNEKENDDYVNKQIIDKLYNDNINSNNVNNITNAITRIKELQSNFNFEPEEEDQMKINGYLNDLKNRIPNTTTTATATGGKKSKKSKKTKKSKRRTKH